MHDDGGGGSDVTVIGLGLMGAALARTLLGAGRGVTVWNRSAGKAAPLVAEGARAAGGAAEAVAASPVVLVCVSDYAATRELLATADLRGKVLVELSTGTPGEARAADAWARADRGADYLDGAIMATPSRVGRPDTTIFVSGSGSAFERAEPLLRDLAGGLRYVGESVGAAAAWDLAILSHAFGGFLGFLHGARLFESEGMPVDALGDAAADLAPVVGEMMRHEGAVIASGRYGDDPESSLRTSAYAFDLLLQHAREAGITDAFPRYAAETFRRGLDAGYGEEETAALIKALR